MVRGNFLKKSDFFWFFWFLDYTIGDGDFIIYLINMKKFMAYILVWVFWMIWFWLIWWNVYAWENEETPKTTEECTWIKLNTNFPIIWNCIKTSKGEKTDPTNAFPYMMGAITKIVMSLILVVCFILIIVAGIMRAWDKPKEGKELMKKVAVAILLLWFSGAILRLINPNFFG